MPNTVGLVINPKDGQLFYAECQNNSVEVFDLDDRYYTEGHFDIGNGSYSWPSRLTDLPRVHTTHVDNKNKTRPALAAEDRGKGLGTVLYTALCMTAFQSNRREVAVNTGSYKGEGICSSGEADQRSPLASAWWTKAENVFGLAETMTGSINDDFSLSVTKQYSEVDSDFYDRLKEIVNLQLPSDHVDITDFKVKVDGEREFRFSAQMYLFGSAVEKSLIAFTLERTYVSHWYKWEESESNYEVFSLGALLAANFGALRGIDNAEKIMGQLVRVASYAGATQSQQDRMWLRFFAGIDIDVSSWQYPDYGYLDPRRSSRTTRPNPRSTRVSKPKPTVNIKQYPAPRGRRIRANPQPSREEMQAEAQQLAADRKRLGWDVFATDD